MTNATAIKNTNAKIDTQVQDIGRRMSIVAKSMEVERQVFVNERENREEVMFQLANELDELKNNMIAFQQDLLAMTQDFHRLGDNFNTLDEVFDLYAQA